MGSVETMNKEAYFTYPSAVINAYAEYASDQPGDALPFYEAEGRLLALWDQLSELKLEIAMMEAQANPPPSDSLEDQGTNGGEEKSPASEDALKRALKEAEKECLEARTAYTLRQSAIEDVLIADPILKAVHSGPNALPTERSLRPLLNRRDILAIASSNLSSIHHNITSTVGQAEADRIALIQKNRTLAPSLTALALDVETARREAIQKSDLGGELEEAEEEAREARKRWRIMKSVVAGVVAGSGVEWATDERLRDLVLDEE